MPLGATSAIRAAGFYEEDPDYIRNLRDGSDVGGVRKYGAQLSALLGLGEDTQVLLRYVHNDARVHGTSVSRFDLPDFTTDRLEEGNERTTNLGIATLTHDFGGATLTSVTGYVDSKSVSQADFSTLFSLFFGLPVGVNVNDVGIRRFSQEVRLISDSEDGPVEWLIGGYYENEKADNFREFFFVDDVLPPEIDRDQTARSKQVAAFAELGWRFAQGWTLTGGGRYAKYDIERTSRTGAPAFRFLETEASTFNPKVSLEFKPNDDQLYYAQASKGFRPGGINQVRRPLPTCFANVPDGFDPDSLWSYEAGVKLSLPGIAGTFNGTVYYSEWTDIPVLLNVTDPNPACGIVGPLLNVGEAEVKGVEAELVLCPAAGLTLSGSVSYSKTTLKEGGDSFAAGQQLPASPNWNLAARANYQFPLSATLDGSLGADVHYLDSYRFYLEDDFAGIPPDFRAPFVTDSQPSIGGYTTVNLRAGVESGRYSLNLFVNNALNDRGLTSLDAASLGDGFAGRSVVRPRTIGLSARMNF